MRYLFAGLLVAAVFPLGPSARPNANDLSPSLTYSALVSSASGSKTETLDFAIGVLLSWDGGVPATVRYEVTFPASLSWAGNAPGTGEGCARTSGGAVCTTRIVPTPGTNLAAAFGPWRVKAEHPGSYRVAASILDSGGTDLNPSNDSSTIDVNVGVGPVRAVVTPRTPKAGSTVAVSSGVFLRSADRTYAVEPSSVVCIAKLGSGAVNARSSRSSGRAVCTIRTPKSARGRMLTGTIRIRASGLFLSKQFTVRLS